MAGYFWGDCFDLVQTLTGLKFYPALEDIAKKFNLIGGSTAAMRVPQMPSVFIRPVECKIEVNRLQSWTRPHLEYFQQYSISKETLTRFKVAPLEIAWLNGQQIFSYYAKNEIAFVYWFGGLDYKLYFPTRPRAGKYPRFMHNNPNILQGYEQLPDSGRYCVITKSMKDVICLSEFHVPAIAPMSETQIISEVAFEELSYRFNKLFSLYDVDNPFSIGSMKQMRSMGIQPLFFKRSQPKDFSDFVQVHGRKDASYLVDYFIDYFFQSSF